MSLKKTLTILCMCNLFFGCTTIETTNTYMQYLLMTGRAMDKAMKPKTPAHPAI